MKIEMDKDLQDLIETGRNKRYKAIARNGTLYAGLIRTMETRNNPRPLMPQHPGLILKEELKERGIKQKEFAAQIGMQPSHLNALLHGARNISPQLATRIEGALKIPARVWLNLQDNYNLDMLRTYDLVDGYTGKFTPPLALAEPDQEETALWDLAFRAGQKDMAQKIMSTSEKMNLTEEQRDSLLSAVMGLL